MTGIRDVNFLLSALNSDPNTVDLTALCRPRTISGLVNLPGVVIVQRAAVRKWTGREGPGSSGSDEESHSSHGSVYVAEHIR